jgi:acyl-CoA synthetase (NDP forming)
MEAIFQPRSVAVYGASRDSSKLGHVLLRNLLEGGFEGQVTAVNPSPGTVLGLPTVPRLSAPADLALVSVPAPAAEAAIADAAHAGCRAAIVLASGFGETGPEGRAAERRLAAIARAAGMRLVGPNCMGVVSRLQGGWLNGSYFWRLPERAGGVSMVSQSGAFGGMFFAEARRRQLGVARFLSVGNCADVTEADALEWLAGDPVTTVVGVFAEAFSDGRRFVEAARRCPQPVVVLKAGKGAAGARAAASHTGSLAGSHGVVRAALRRAGAVEAQTSADFFDALQALAIQPAAAPALAILTISGGPSVLAADAAERVGLTLPAPAESTVRRLRELAPSFAATGNPIDLTPQCPSSSFGPAVQAVFDDAAFGGVVAINCGLDAAAFGEAVAAAHRRTGKPVTAFCLEVPAVEAALARAGIPLLPGPERAVAAYAALVRR